MLSSNKYQLNLYNKLQAKVVCLCFGGPLSFQSHIRALAHLQRTGRQYP